MKYKSVTTQMKATEQYFPVVLFIMLYKVALTFESVDEILKCDHSNKAIEQYFPVVLCIMLNKIILILKSVDRILTCDHSNESFSPALFYAGRCNFVSFKGEYT